MVDSIFTWLKDFFFFFKKKGFCRPWLLSRPRKKKQFHGISPFYARTVQHEHTESSPQHPWSELHHWTQQDSTIKEVKMWVWEDNQPHTQSGAAPGLSSCMKQDLMTILAATYFNYVTWLHFEGDGGVFVGCVWCIPSSFLSSRQDIRTVSTEWARGQMIDAITDVEILKRRTEREQSPGEILPGKGRVERKSESKWGRSLSDGCDDQPGASKTSAWASPTMAAF